MTKILIRSFLQVCLSLPYFAFALLFMPYFKCFEQFFLSVSLNSLPRSAISNIHNIAREMEIRKGGARQEISGARVQEKRARK